MSTIEIVFLSVIGGFFLWSFWQTKTAARKIKKASDDLQKETALFRASPKDYPHLDAAWYDERERDLLGLGFRLIGNLGMEGVQSYVRACASSDGQECVGVYHLRFTGIRALTMRMIGFREQYATEATTSFSDGRIVTTTTVPESSLLTAPELLQRIHIDPEASVRKVVMLHSERVAGILAERPDLEVIPVRNFEDLMASVLREEEIKRAHHAANGGITREDLERLGGPKNRGIAHRVYDEIEELGEKEAR